VCKISSFPVTQHHLFFFFSVANHLDPRTNDWPLIKSPVPGLTIIGLYLYFVNSWGPRYMKDRKPYQFKHTLIAYNFIQVLISFYLFFEVSC
jgi:elongation of very long chain fatty acids protein 7